VPPTSPEIVQLNIADHEIRTRMAQIRIPSTLSGGRDDD
jgi:hypothetical protein